MGIDLMASRRRIILNSPHLATPTPANPVSFAATLAAPLKALACAFSPVQAGSGDPSPENVRAISGWTGVNISRTGVNLFDIEHPLFSAASSSILSNYPSKVENGVIANGGRTGLSAGSGITIPVIPGKYTLSFKTNGEDSSYEVRAVTLNNDNTWASNTTLINSGGAKPAGEKTATVTFPAGYTHLLFAAYSATKYGSWETDMQIEVGEEVNAYEPYTGSQVSVEFPAMGANLFDPFAWVALRTNSTFYQVASDQTITVTRSDNSGISARMFQLEPNTQYAVYFDGFSSIAIFNSQSANILINMIFTVPSDGKIALKVYGSTYPTSGHVSIVKGGTAPSSWEPYTNTIYGGTIDPVRGVARAEWGMKDLGSLAWTSRSNGVFSLTMALNPAPASTSKFDILCSSYKVNNSLNATTILNRDKVISSCASYLLNGVMIHDSDYASATAAEFQAAMIGVQLVYELATSIEYPLTPAQLKTLKGANVIYTSLNGDITPIYWTN